MVILVNGLDTNIKCKPIICKGFDYTFLGVSIKMTAMKIGIDIRDCTREKTGKGWYAYNIIVELLKLDKKNQYVLFSNSKNNPFSKFTDDKKNHFAYIEGRGWKWHLKAIKQIKNSGIDVFFAPSSYIIPAFAPKNIKMVITIHDLVAFILPKAHNAKAILIERATLKKALKKADAVFAVSENTKKDILERFRFPAGKIFITECAPAEFYKSTANEEEIAETLKKYKIPRKFILAVGTLEPRKNFDTLIKAFVNIKRKFPDYKLVIAGKKGWKFKNIEETVKKFKLENDVIFPGYLKDSELKYLYSAAKVFAFPSLYEGFGIPPLEAMSCGCPVVSSNIASLPGVIEEAGLLIDPRNAYKMADAIMSFLEDEDFRQKFIERGKAQAAKFSWKESAKQALEVFESLSN
jgi:glycosyltransferase involved in cell wall biosynthesis